MKLTVATGLRDSVLGLPLITPATRSGIELFLAFSVVSGSWRSHYAYSLALVLTIPMHHMLTPLCISFDVRTYRSCHVFVLYSLRQVRQYRPSSAPDTTQQQPKKDL